jgi:hypothetical protein
LNLANAISAFGILSTNQFDVSLLSNTIQNNVNNAGVNHKYLLTGILNSAGSPGTNANINDNQIILVSGATISTLKGIDNTGGTSATVNILSNTIKLGCPNGTTSIVRGIENSSQPTILNINSNIIEGIAGEPIAGTGVVDFIMNYTTSNTQTVNTNNNLIKNFERTGGSGTMYGIRIRGNNWTANGNTIDNLKFSNSTSAGNIYAIYNMNPSGSTCNYTNNIIRNLTTATVGELAGVFDGYNGTKTVTGNTISNFYKVAGSAPGGYHWGINLFDFTTAAISKNTIFGFDGNASATYGIYTSSVVAHSIFENKIYNFQSTSNNCNVRC